MSGFKVMALPICRNRKPEPTNHHSLPVHLCSVAGPGFSVFLRFQSESYSIAPELLLLLLPVVTAWLPRRRAPRRVRADGVSLPGRGTT